MRAVQFDMSDLSFPASLVELAEPELPGEEWARVEVSTGGMSIKSAEDLTIGANVEVSFALMTLPRVNVRGVVSWKKPKSIGVRFDPADDRRMKVKSWIDSYLEN